MEMLTLCFPSSCYVLICVTSFSGRTFHPDLLHQQFPSHRCAAKLFLQEARLTGMSQLQFQCVVSPMPTASAPLQLGQPQPGYSIPCPSGTLPSESASQPIRSSALPAGSATPYNSPTGWLSVSRCVCVSCVVTDGVMEFVTTWLLCCCSI